MLSVGCFSNRAIVAQGLDELRNLYGTGHGRVDGANFTARHARLAIRDAVNLLD